MGTTISVRDYLGKQLMRASVDMGELLRSAEELGLPLLSGVDIYDDTTFNRKQCAGLRDELVPLSQIEGLMAAVESLMEAVALVDETPHRYVVFNGD
jgi:hypothetical protein